MRHKNELGNALLLERAASRSLAIGLLYAHAGPMSFERFTRFARLVLCPLFILSWILPLRAVEVGVARVDITPDYPILMNGYFYRTEPSDGFLQRIYAKALAIGSDKEGVALLISADNCGLPNSIRPALVERLKKRGVAPDRVAVCVSHTHAAPKLAGNLDNIFGKDISPKDQEQIDRYTREFLDRLEQAAVTALKNRQAAHILFGQSKVGFAKNRRVPDGPVDHDLPMLKVVDQKGNTLAVLVNYACHCTTLGADNRKICGDWAGFAQAAIEKEFPNAIAMTLAGCGGECNPFPLNQLEYTKAHGQAIADAVHHRVSNNLVELSGPVICRTKTIQLPFDTLPSRKELEALAKTNNPTGYNARKQLASMDRGEALPKSLPYKVQTWSFAECATNAGSALRSGLTMVFLAGEVVGDYSLRLKEELDRERLWVTAYANNVPCYIPSRRVWKMHGYETELSMVYYGLPTRLSENIEDQIIATVHELAPSDLKRPLTAKPEAERAKLEVYLLMGQSNMQGRGKLEGQDRTPNPRVFTLSPSNHWELAVEPLHGSGPRAGFGPGLVFGKIMALENTNVCIGLVPCAVGATELRRWERGGDLYSNAVNRARIAMLSGTVKGVLWHQGEQDSMTSTNSNSYYDRLSRMIVDFRTDLNAPNLPFVCGQIGEFLYTRKVQQTPYAKTINEALARIPDHVPATACVSASGLTHTGDEVHFDGKSQRELGKRFAAEMSRLVK